MNIGYAIFLTAVFGLDCWLFYQFYKSWKAQRELQRKFDVTFAEMLAAIRQQIESKDHT